MRAEIIRDLRLDVFDVLVGINLLREGLDIPEITLVAILDADKEGFLRSETSLIQTIGRAARNSEGHVIMYADRVTDSMRVAIEETERRRKLQQEYNEAHGITPQTIQKSVRDLIAISKKVEVVMPDEYMGDVIGNLTSRRCRIEGTDTRGNAQVVDAICPLSEMFGYATDLRSRTQGRGTFTMQFDHYEQVSEAVAKKILGK